MNNIYLFIIIFSVWWIISLYLFYIKKIELLNKNKSFINIIYYLILIIGGLIFIISLINIINY